uniref:Uncharacterized protein n=1 Tax=Octopus bimaculoides TaxID=37653 RepID=A0A0L8G172_OCTBM
MNQINKRRNKDERKHEYKEEKTDEKKTNKNKLTKSLKRKRNVFKMNIKTHLFDVFQRKKKKGIIQ